MKDQQTQISHYIRQVVKKERPETVKLLIRLVQQKYRLSEQEIMNIVCRAGVRFTKRSTSAYSGLRDYLVTTNARWYWVTIALCILAATFVLILPTISIMVYIRYLLGSVLVFWMLGHGLVKSLFPGRKLERLELIVLSLGTSTVLVPMIAFILHYTPWAIKLGSVTVVLLSLTLALSTLAVFREHQNLSIH